METSRRFFIMGCLVEGGMFLAGAALCHWVGPGLGASIRWDGRDAMTGLGGALLPLGLFLWACHSRWSPLREIRHFLDQMVLPIIRGWSLSQVLVVSLLAGLGEEFLFRGAIQGGLGRLVGDWPALVLASLMFGLCHPMTWGYLVLTALMGAYLGVFWLWTGNLLVPVLLHAAYDFVALIYFLRICEPEKEDQRGPDAHP